MELYTHTPDEEPDLNRKVKKNMLKKKGLSSEEIEKMVDSLDLVFDQGGVDGEFDDMPYTPCKLVKRIFIEPPSFSDIIDAEPEPQEKDKGVSQLMLQQYYGDADKERERNAAFKRYKSHIGKKNIEVFDDKTGEKRTIEIYGITDYVGKAKDTKELRITGFETRLEKLSRAIQGDFSLYETQLSKLSSHARSEMMDVYESLRETDPELAKKIKDEVESQLQDMSSEEGRHKIIQTLIDKDIEFIETNNYSYNSHQHIQENLKTLGKHGEKSIKHTITKEHSKLEKVGLPIMNALITLRNTIKAPIHKAVGTYVAAPIHRLLFNVSKTNSKGPISVNGYEITPIEDMLAISQQRSAGAFKNKPTHRYQARKAYFIEQEKLDMMATDNGSPTTLKNKIKNIYKLAFVPRIKAIVNYKEGNVAVLNAGANDEIELSQKSNLAIGNQSVRLRTTHKKIKSYEKDIDDLQILLRHAETPEQKVQLERTIESRKKGLLKEEVKRNELERMEIDDVPVDAIGLSEHDKAVKSDLTKVVTGVKTASRVVAGYLISNYIYDDVPGKDQVVEEEIFHPASKEPDQVITQPGLDQEGISNISLDDLDNGATRTLMHDTYNPGARSIEAVTPFNRGGSFTLDGKKFSGADIEAMKINPNYAMCTIDQPLDGSTPVHSVIQEILEKTTGDSYTSQEILDMISSGRISDFRRCLSRSDVGIPSGHELESTLDKVISSGTHQIIIPGKEIPAHIETVYKVVTSNAERVINAPAVAALSALAAGELSDFNDVLRHTKSEPGKIRNEIEYEISRAELEQAKMTKEAQKGQEGKEQGTQKSDVKPNLGHIKKNIDVMAFQRNNKPKARKYSCQPNIPGFKGFSGTKREDLGKHDKLGKSGFNENEILGFAKEPSEYDEFSKYNNSKKKSTDDLEIWGDVYEWWKEI